MSPSATPRRKHRRSKDAAAHEAIATEVLAALDDAKALNVRRLDVAHLTTVTDVMVFASGRSDRHVRSIADAVVERLKEAGYPPLGMEGQQGGEWVLVDFADVVVHVMRPRIREFYNIEKLWDISAREARDADS